MAKKKESAPKVKEPDMAVENAEPLSKTTDSGDGIWGVILIAGGFIFLLNTLGLISWDIWSTFGTLWPVLLILWGIQILLGNSRVARGIMIVITTLVLVVIALFAIGQEHPELRMQMPSLLESIFTVMEGVRT